MLSLRKSIRLLGSGTVAMAFGAGLLGAAHTASAAPATATATTTTCGVLSPAGQPASDSIKLPNVGGISFGSGGVDGSNNPICGASLQWKIPPNTIQPSLVGTLSMKNALGKTAHVQVSYYDIHGNLVTGAVSADVLATSNDQQSFPVNIFRPNDPRIYRMSVSTQVKDLTKSTSTKTIYTTQSETNAYMGSPNHPAVDCKIDTDGVELGGSGGVSGGHPVNAASCGWVVNPTSVQAQVTGTEYFEDGVGREARILLSTYDVHGTWLGDYPIASNSPKVNGVTHFPVSGSSGTGNLSDRTYRAQVVVQFLVGSNWQQQGSAVTWYI